MDYRPLGRAGMKVSAVSLGAWLTYGGSVEDDTAARCIHSAIEHGVNFIDCADAYAGGHAEEVVGQIIKDYKRSDLVLSSKLYWPMSENVNDRGLSRKHIMESIDKTLARFGTDYIDIYFCHRYDPETPVEEVVRAMDDLVHQGKVLYWGTSVWSAAQIEDAVGTARRYNCYLPQVEQPRYNMFDRHIEPEIMPTAAKHGMGITVFSPLDQGILTGKYNDGVPAGSRASENERLRSALGEAQLAKVRRMTEIANDLGVTMAQLTLAWILRRPEISSVITGATRPEQIAANVQAADLKLTEDVQAQIEQILGDE
ncbi:MAG: aldo/keto reductase family protein [Caldilineaceae bacterium]|nr:aldo/keto reductase family protein [Caldilineaceae bacterium]